MTIEEADDITNSYGKHLELFHGKLIPIFLTEIPQSLLPFSIEKIEEAIEIMIKFYANKGDAKAVAAFDSARAFLISYIDDDEALTKLAAEIHDPGRKAFRLEMLKRIK